MALTRNIGLLLSAACVCSLVSSCAAVPPAAHPAQGHHGPAAGAPACEACRTEVGHAAEPLPEREVDRRYRFLVSATPSPPTAGRVTRLEVRILDAAGRPVTTLQVHHERLVHFLIVSENLEEFHHLHPEDFDLLTEQARREARFVIPVTFGMGGRYVLAMDFVDRGKAVHKELDLTVRGPAQPPTRWDFSRVRRVDGMECRLHTMPDDVETRSRVECNVELREGGKAVTDLQPYLGVLTHLAIFREGASASAHVHGGGPEFAHQHFHEPTPGYRGPKLYFGHVFLRPGRYRIFAQFRRAGRVYTVPFDIEVRPPRHDGA